MPRQQLKLVENPSHEELFLERYDRLMKWALHLADKDRQAAEDLLQEAFIQFTFSQPEISGINNVESYIYGILRHLHLSQIRKAANRQWQQFSPLECDSAEIGLRRSSILNDLEVLDELRGICEFVCFRKESSKAASVLILRFFHGYYPREIADVLNNSIQTVKVWLYTARGEAKAYLNDPEKLRFLRAEKHEQTSPVRDFNSLAGDTAAILAELRQTIFSAIRGKHLTEDRLTELYGKTTDEIAAALSVDELAHLVSCASCLDRINIALDLPLLADRYPTDMIGKDSNKNDSGGGGFGRGGGNGGDSGGSGSPNAGRLLRMRAREVFEHFPRELQVAVNGYVHTAQKVNSAKSEFSLSLGDDESIDFIEIFGGQQTRLMLMPVASPPPEGPLEQKESIELSENRRIDLQLVFGSPKPTLQVVYSDPTFVPDDVHASFANLNPSEINRLSSNSVKEAVVVHESQTEGSKESHPIGSEFGNLLQSERSIGWLDLRSWLNPFRLALAFTALAIAFGLFYLYQPATPPVITAESVMEKVRTVEAAVVASADTAVHRNYQIEEWSGGSLRSRKRVDQWQKQGGMAERVYDETGKMIAGEWSDTKFHRVFTQGQKLSNVETKEMPADRTDTPDPTLLAFMEFVRTFETKPDFSLTEEPKTYTLGYKKDPSAPARLPIDLLMASLSIDRETYNPVSQTIELQLGEEVREYRISDVRVEQKPLSSVSPLVFLPEEELLRGATKVVKPLEIAMPLALPPGADALSTQVNTGSAHTATHETEVEVFRALDSVNALSGDQITVTRLADGRLRVNGIVDSPSRKAEILNALGPVKNAAGLTIDIQTAEEAANGTKPKISGQDITIESVTAQVEQLLPVEPELKEYFAKKGIAGEELDTHIKSYSASVLDRSRAMRRNALALKQLAERFSPAEIQQLEPAKRDEWRTLLRSKAAAIVGDVRSLDSQLSAISLAVGGGEASDVDIREAADVSKAAQRLFGLAAECDAQVGQSFSISGRGKGVASVKTVQFWRNLRMAGDLAAEIQRF